MVRREATPGEVTPFAARPRKRVPHEFVLDALAALSPRTRPMFGCLAVYVEDKIVLILRDKDKAGETDNGVWLATTEDHHRSLRGTSPPCDPLRFWGRMRWGRKQRAGRCFPPTLRILRKRPCVLANSFLREILESGKCRERGDRRRRRKPKKAVDRRRTLDCHPGRILDCHPDPERSRRGGIGS